MTRRPTSRATWFRAAAAAAAVVAALGPEAAVAREPVLRVLLVDVSASTGRRAPSDEELAALRAGLGRGDATAVVAFADGAAVLAGPSAPQDLVVTPRTIGPWATSLAAGLSAASPIPRAGRRVEFLVATDARVTDDPSALAETASRIREVGGADVRVLPVASVPQNSVIEDLRGPGRVVVGEVVALEASGTAGPAGATVQLIGSGAVLETRHVARPGPFRVVFARVADAPGLATWDARTAEWPEAPPATARVVVAAPGAVTVLSAGAPRPELSAALGRIGAVVDVSGVKDRNALRGALAGHDAVVVDAVPEGEDGIAWCASELAAYVRAGGGLLVLGGAPTFAYENVDAGTDGAGLALPLRGTPPDDSGSALYLAVDGSGSMAEPWPGAAGGIARDTVVRAAADVLVRGARPGTRLVVRRFRERLDPEATPGEIALGAGPRDVALDAIRRLPGPGGSTAFLPVLAEAFDVLGARGEPTRVALLLTDGRSSEDVALLRAAVTKLAGAGVRVAVVVPGRIDAAAAGASLLRAVDGTAATVRGADDPARLGAVLVDAERTARGPDPLVTDRVLEPTADAAPILSSADIPPRAGRLHRTWPAPDATVLVRTVDGIPVAAVRREGRGSVGALAARALDPAWLDGDRGAALVGAMVRAVRRRGSASLRVERDGDLLRARIGTTAGASPARWVVRGDDRFPLFDAGGGVVAADVPPGGRETALRFVTDDGVEVASSAIDSPAPLEVRGAPQFDIDALAARLRPDAPPRGTPLRPWLAGLAVVLLVVGSVKSGSRPTR